MTKQRIFKSLILLTFIVFSYVCLLLILTNEGLKSSSTMIKDNRTDLSGAISLQNVKFNEIKINKNLIDVE